MTKPVLKLEAGKLNVSVAHTIDTDGDLKPAGMVAMQLQLDPAEVISEIAKKDMPLLEAIFASLKA